MPSKASRLVAVVLMRSAGCVINDYADRNIDPHVRRTRERPIAAGRVTLVGSPTELAQRFPGHSLEEIFVEAVQGAERGVA